MFAGFSVGEKKASMAFTIAPAAFARHSWEVKDCTSWGLER